MDINDAGLAGTSIEQLIRAADISNPMTVEGQAAVADLAKVGLRALSDCADTLRDAEPSNRPAAIVSLLDEDVLHALATAWRHSANRVLAGFAGLSNVPGSKSTVNEVMRQVKRVASEQEKQLRERLRRSMSGSGAVVNLSKLLEHDDIPAGLSCPTGWSIDREGVWSIKVSEEGVEERTKVAPSPFLIVGRRWDIHDGETQLRLAWKRGERWTFRTVARSDAMDSRPLVALSKWDAPINSRNAAMMVQFMSDFEAENLARLPTDETTAYMGWQSDSGRHGFMLGEDQVSCDDDPVVHLVPDDGLRQVADGWSTAGTWDGWVSAMAPAMSRPMLMVALYAAAASPLLQVLDAPNFIVDFSGETSRGKTTALRVAASMYGKPDERAGGIIYSWDATRVWIEQAAGFLHSLPLLLDDTKRARYKGVVSQTMYDYAFGQGRGRGSPTGIRTQVSWRSVLLTTGEAPATSFSEDAGTRARVLTLKGSPLGEQSIANARIAMELKSALSEHYGHLGLKMSQYLVENRGRWAQLRSRYRKVRDAYVTSAGNDGVAARLAVYVAVMDVAASILHKQLGVPKPTCAPLEFMWTAVLDGSRDADRPKAAMQDLYGWAVANQLRLWGRHETDARDGTPRVPSSGWAGSWPTGDKQPIAVLPQVVRRLLTDWNYDHSGIIESWARRGWLSCTKNTMTRPMRIDGGRSRCMVFDSTILEALNEDE